jgi:membrane-associated phospholipid phosphatase
LVFLLSLVFIAPRFGSNARFLQKLLVVMIAASVLAIPSRAQTTVPEQGSPAAALPSNESPETAAPEKAAPAPASPAPASADADSERPVSWKLLFHNWVDDQKHIWTFPARLAQGQNLLPTVAVVGATAGLFYVDPIEARYFRGTKTFDGFRTVFNGNAASIGMGATAASMYAIGRIRKDAKMQRTALFVGEAMADTALVQTVLKDATMRLRPVSYPSTGWFVTSSSATKYIRGNSSFPSGHSMEAFAVATIIARRYGKSHRWVPYVAYGLASTVAFSRLTLNVHFLSDVVMGGAIGYSISRFTVLRNEPAR